MSSEILEAALLGILQGLTEFLPVSSSAHLLILPWFMNWTPFGLGFDVLVHGGTLLALLYYFRSDLSTMARDLVRPGSAQPPLFWVLALGTLPAIGVGLAFSGVIEDKLRHPAVTVVTLSAFGILLGLADRFGSGGRSRDSFGWRDGLIVGAGQALALVPGVSRSGITITAALLLGFNRIDSARFSFLLGIPVIALATLAKIYDLARAGCAESTPVAVLAFGVLFSAVSGFLCIKYLLRFLQTRSFAPFVVYRLLLAAFILWSLL